MRVRVSKMLAGLMVAAALILVAQTAPAQDLPKGVTFKVLAEFPSDIPGIEKVQLQELRLEPGAKWEDTTVMDTGY